MCWEGGEPASACSHLAHSPLLGGPPEAPGTQGCSGSKWSKLGARGASWGLPEANGGGNSKT